MNTASGIVVKINSKITKVKRKIHVVSGSEGEKLEASFWKL